MEKYLMISLEDERAKYISEVLKNNTCKKILDLLSEKELTESEIAKTLKLPLNTTDYNIKKLLKADLIETTKNYFWSIKGKKIPVYKVSNKFIIISPKSKNYFKPMVLSILISCALTFLIWFFSSSFQRMTIEETMLKATPEMAEAKSFAFQSFLLSLPSWAWFLAGSLIALVIYAIILIISWKRLIKL